MLEAFGEHRVCVVMLCGFDTKLSEDNERFRFVRRKGYLPSLQGYWPIDVVPSRLPEDSFDIDLDAAIRLALCSNGENREKYLLWVSTLYFERYGRYYKPLVEILYRYNNEHRLDWFRMNPDFRSNDLDRDRRDSLPGLRRELRQGRGPAAPRGLIRPMGVETALRVASE